MHELNKNQSHYDPHADFPRVILTVPCVGIGLNILSNAHTNNIINILLLTINYVKQITLKEKKLLYSIIIIYPISIFKY